MVYSYMLEELINSNILKYSKDIEKLGINKNIDCITIFPNSLDDYHNLNKEASKVGIIIENMNSGNLYYLKDGIITLYGTLSFIKIRKYDENYLKYRISVDFTIDDFEKYKKKLTNPIIKQYDTFELIQFKNDNSIINIVSLSTKEDYNI